MKTKIEIARDCLQRFIKMPIKDVSTKNETMYVTSAIQACVDSINEANRWLEVKDYYGYQIAALGQVIIKDKDGNIDLAILEQIGADRISAYRWVIRKGTEIDLEGITLFRILELKLL